MINQRYSGYQSTDPEGLKRYLAEKDREEFVKDVTKYVKRGLGVFLLAGTIAYTLGKLQAEDAITAERVIQSGDRQAAREMLRDASKALSFGGDIAALEKLANSK